RHVAEVLDHQALDVEDDVGDVLDDAGDGADLVLDVLDLDAGDGTALQRGQQHAPQAVADRGAQAALERLDGELAVGVRQRRAVADHAAGQLQATPSNSHVRWSPWALASGGRQPPVETQTGG